MKVEYQDDMKIAYYNGERFTRDDRTGYYLSSRKVPEFGTRMRLHKYVWQIERGLIPKGCQVHHKDSDKSHNDIDNLECLTEHEHLSYHSKRFATESRELLDMSLSYAREAAKEWHKSPEGRKWHREHYKKIGERLHMERSFICAFCGKEFKNTAAHSRFCSNNCKAAWRRKSHVDDVKRICIVCGREFMIDKYRKTLTCSRECGGKRRRVEAV